jgi:hypothetical protein
MEKNTQWFSALMTAQQSRHSSQVCREADAKKLKIDNDGDNRAATDISISTEPSCFAALVHRFVIRSLRNSCDKFERRMRFLARTPFCLVTIIHHFTCQSSSVVQVSACDSTAHPIMSGAVMLADHHASFEVPARFAKAYMTAELFCGKLGGRQQYVVITTRWKLSPVETLTFVSPRSVATEILTHLRILQRHSDRNI